MACVVTPVLMKCGYGPGMLQLLQILIEMLNIPEDIGSRLDFLCFFRDSLGSPRLRAYTHLRGTASSLGSYSNHIACNKAEPY